jgi:hypothetical protein
VKARLREELKSAAARKTARADVENDLALLQQMLALQPTGLASTAGSADESRIQSAAAPFALILIQSARTQEGATLEPGSIGSKSPR